MKKRRHVSRFPEIYLLVVPALMYLPILIVMLYSFNESKISSVWTGFSLKWYRELFRDRTIGTALINSLILGGVSSLAAAVIGTSALLSEVNWLSVGSAALLAGILSLLTSIATGLPEAENHE